jgi:8-hydroxy-5-deazaflavin:NADPH oxidoreductase
VRIGIVGAGALGSALAEGWTGAGHQTAIADPDDAPAAETLAARIGPSSHAASVEDAGGFGEVTVLAIPFGDRDRLPSSGVVAGQIVIDAMEGLVDHGSEDAGTSVVVAGWFPDSAVVKAFNTVEPETLRTRAKRSIPRDRRLVVFLAGDNVRANARVSTLIEELGFAPVQTGSLARGDRFQRPGSRIFHRDLLPAEARRLLALMR